MRACETDRSKGAVRTILESRFGYLAPQPSVAPSHGSIDSRGEIEADLTEKQPS
jgi:hypothetical protein